MIKLNLDKRTHFYGVLSLTWIVGLSLFLASCSVKPEPLSVEQQMIEIEKDLAAISLDRKKVTKPLSLYEAMARAVQHNFDQQIQAYDVLLKKTDIDLNNLDLLPELNLQYTSVRRSNDPEIVFQSSGTSLPPYKYGENSKSLANLELSWNILDYGLSYARTQQQADRYLIAKESRRKVLQGLIEQTRQAYFKAAASDKILKEIDVLIDDANKNLEKARHIEEIGLKAPLEILTYQADLLETMRSLIQRRKGLITAKLELANLINLENSDHYDLVFDDIALSEELPSFETNGEALEMFALMNRPELREAFYNHRSAARDIRAEVMNTFPGLGISIGGNYNSDEFLVHNQWLSLATGFAGNLMRIFTLDNRLEKAETKEKLEALRRKAMVAAILSQVKIGYVHFDQAHKDYAVFQSLSKVNKRLLETSHQKLEKGEISKADLIAARARHVINQLEQYYAYIDLHGEYARLITTLGIDVLPENYMDIETEALADNIEKNFQAIDYQTIESLVDDMRQKTQAFILEEEKKKAPKKKSYKQILEEKKKQNILEDVGYMGFVEVNE